MTSDDATTLERHPHAETERQDRHWDPKALNLDTWVSEQRSDSWQLLVVDGLAAHT